MPMVTATPRGTLNGEVVTEFTDVTSTTSVTYTYPSKQYGISIENSGVTDIFVTVGTFTNQIVKPDKTWKAEVSFSSFSIRSNANSQEFIATSFQSDKTIQPVYANLAQFHRVLVTEANPNYIPQQLPLALDAFRGGLLVENCSYESLVMNADEWKNQFDVLVLAGRDLIPYQYAVNATDVKNAVAKFMNAGCKLLWFSNNGYGANMQKSTVTGGTETAVGFNDILSGLSYSGPNSFSAATGAFQKANPYPLPFEILRPGTMKPSSATIPNLISTDPATVFPIEAVQGATVSKCVAYKPGKFMFVAYGGTIANNVPDSSYFKYVDIDKCIKLLLGKDSDARLALDCKQGRPVAAVGVDLDETTNKEAVVPILKAFGSSRKLELGIVAKQVTVDLAAWYRSIPGITLVSHTFSHASDRITTTDELQKIDPVTQLARVNRPFRAVITGVKRASDSTVITVSSGGIFANPPAGTCYTTNDPEYTTQSQLGYVKFNAADVGDVLISYTADDEYKEYLGSINLLRDLGAISKDAVYTTAGSHQVHSSTFKYALEKDIPICDYQYFPNYTRLSVAVYPMHDKAPTPYGFSFFSDLGNFIVDTTWLKSYTKADLKATFIPNAIQYCKDSGFPFVTYIHDFPFSDVHSQRVHGDPAARWNDDWSKPTLQETRDYMQEFLSWLIAQFEAQNCIWMTRAEYTQRYYDLQRYVQYGVEATSVKTVITVQNQGRKMLDGLTFKIPFSKAPTRVEAFKDIPLNYTYASGMVALWLDMPAGSSAVIEVQ